jgi:hypothetical protein
MESVMAWGNDHSSTISEPELREGLDHYQTL